jgi:hypothetical protein
MYKKVDPIFRAGSGVQQYDDENTMHIVRPLSLFKIRRFIEEKKRLLPHPKNYWSDKDHALRELIGALEEVADAVAEATGEEFKKWFVWK